MAGAITAAEAITMDGAIITIGEHHCLAVISERGRLSRAAFSWAATARTRATRAFSSSLGRCRDSAGGFLSKIQKNIN